MTEEEKETFTDALNEYYKLKTKYEDENNKNKKRIINNQTLSLKEKRSEYQKLKPKCINCKRPGGTIFSSKYYEENGENHYDEYRQLKAICGVTIDPCALNITIDVGKYRFISEILTEFDNDIKEIKDNIIEHKNKLLFGYMTTEEAVGNFNKLKEQLSEYTSYSQLVIEKYYQIVDNSKDKQTLREDIEKSYVLIDNIKKNIEKFKETNNTQFVVDIANIYDKNLRPLLIKIRNLKYKENFVWHNDDTNTYHLIQKKNSIQQLEYNEGTQKIVKFKVGFGGREEKTEEEEPKFIVKPSFTQAQRQAPVLTQQQTGPLPETVETIRIPPDNPIYGKGENGDDVKWNRLEYNNVWDDLPIKLKDVLKTDKEWLKLFMFNCVNARVNKKPCKMTAPPSLKVPPNQTVLSNGDTDFGVPIYNEVYNNKLESIDKKNLLQFYSIINGKKEYNDQLFKTVINKYVAKEVGLTEQF